MMVANSIFQKIFVERINYRFKLVKKINIHYKLNNDLCLLFQTF